jgi:hypothetical protein
LPVRLMSRCHIAPPERGGRVERPIRSTPPAPTALASVPLAFRSFSVLPVRHGPIDQYVHHRASAGVEPADTPVAGRCCGSQGRDTAGCCRSDSGDSPQDRQTSGKRLAVAGTARRLGPTDVCLPSKFRKNPYSPPRSGTPDRVTVIRAGRRFYAAGPPAIQPSTRPARIPATEGPSEKLDPALAPTASVQIGERVSVIGNSLVVLVIFCEGDDIKITSSMCHIRTPGLERRIRRA